MSSYVDKKERVQLYHRQDQPHDITLSGISKGWTRQEALKPSASSTTLGQSASASSIGGRDYKRRPVTPTLPASAALTLKRASSNPNRGGDMSEFSIPGGWQYHCPGVE